MEPTAVPEKNNGGCFKTGCLGVIGFMGLLVVVGIIGNIGMSLDPQYQADQAAKGEADEAQARADQVSDQVTVVSSDYNFALLDRSAIADFEQDMDSNPVLNALTEQLKEYEPGSMEFNQVFAVWKSTFSNIFNNLARQYVANGRAVVIAPGTYTATDYFDNNGDPVVPQVRDFAWCEIAYQGKTVYIFDQLHSPP